MKSTVDYAIFYLSKNIPVIPLRSKDKRPAIDSWTQYQSQMPSSDEINSWFGNGSNFNIGIVTGEISQMVVVDLDGPDAIKFARENNFPLTPTVKTARGFHLYFQYKDGMRNFQKRSDLPGIDFRAAGGYAVAPPSIHETRVQYRWVDGRTLDDLPLAEMPDIILIPQQEQKKPLNNLYNGTLKGSRNDSLARLCGSWVSDGLSYEECMESALIWNKKNNPPLPQKEIERTIHSIFKRHTTKAKESQKKISQADKLVKISEAFTIFHDQHHDAYCFLSGEAVLLRSKRMKQHLALQLYKQENKAPNSDSLSQALNVIEARALAEGKKIKLYNRVAEIKEEGLYYDLGGDALKITANGWSIEKSPILFKRYAHQQKQVTPIREGNPWLVFDYLNVPEEQHLLVLIYIISCFLDIPHPIFHPHGAQGSGKSCLFKAIKKICDPSSIEAAISPRDYNELVQMLAHHYVCLFDNLSALPGWMSDVLAMACTGSGFSKRMLFSDDEDIIYELKRCIGINGINALITRPDLMDRSILLPLERIEPTKRIEESRLWQNFEQAKPSILGGIFNTLSRALYLYPEVKIERLPRMADFFHWGCAIAEALDKSSDDFSKAYQSNIEKQNEEVLLGNSLMQAVIQFMSDKEEWNGIISDAYEQLSELITLSKDDKSFPSHQNRLRSALNRIKANLIDYGITFTISDFRINRGVPISFRKVSDLSAPSAQSVGGINTESEISQPECENVGQECHVDGADSVDQSLPPSEDSNKPVDLTNEDIEIIDERGELS
jgi:hypothetical protein